MIRCNMGRVYIDGTTSVLKSELSTLMYSLLKDRIVTAEDLEECLSNAIEVSKMTSEEIDDKLNDAVQSLSNKLGRLMDILKED